MVCVKNLLRVSQNEEVMAMNWPPTSGVVFLSSLIKIIKEHVVLIMRIINAKENKHGRFQQKGPKEPNVKALKEHVLGSLQRRNLAHSSRRERNFIIEKNYFGFVNKN